MGGKEGRERDLDYCSSLSSFFFVETKGDVALGEGGCRVDDAVFTRKGWKVKHQVNIDVGNLELRESLLEPIQFWIFFLSFSFSFSKILNITMNDCNCLKFHVVSNRKGKSYF